MTSCLDAAEAFVTELPDERPHPTLSMLLSTLGPGLLRVAVAPLGLGVTLGPITIHDPQEREPAYDRGVVLGVGVDLFRSESTVLLETLADRGAALLVVKGEGDLPPRSREAAERGGLAVATIPEDASWSQVHSLVRTALGAASTMALAGRAPSAEAPGTALVALGNLFRLADAIGALVGGATTIEDPDSMVLAYSTIDDAPIDLPRQQTILGHRVPTDWIRKLHAAGVFRRLLTDDEVVHFVDPDGELRPRLAVAVRAGGEPLGTIWVVEGRTPFDERAKDALRDASRIAALHLIQHRNSVDFERNRRSENLRAVLRGDLPASTILETLEAPSEFALTVLAFHLPDLRGPELSLRLQRMVDLVSLYCAAYRRTAGAVVLGDAVYLVLAEAPGRHDRVRVLATELAARILDSLKIAPRIGLSETASDVSRLLDLRSEADVALRVLRHVPKLGPVAVISELRSQAMLLDLREFFERNPSVMPGKLLPLIDEDLRRGSGYIDTLRAYLEHFGDIAGAAATIPVHSNTFRYRMSRLTQLADIDLDDPDERLVLQLQLRMLR